MSIFGPFFLGVGAPAETLAGAVACIAFQSQPEYVVGQIRKKLEGEIYAAYRMARLGLIVMELCRPVPFRDDEVPSLTSLVGNVLKRRSEENLP